MSELKAVHAFDVYEAYTKTGDDDAAQVYLKSEADKVIARHKYKRCLAMAEAYKERTAFYAGFASCDEEYRREERACKNVDTWLKIADKFKEEK